MVNCRATMEKDCMWVAIAYHQGFFIRNITALNSEDNIAIDFRRKTKEENTNGQKKKILMWSVENISLKPCHGISAV